MGSPPGPAIQVPRCEAGVDQQDIAGLKLDPGSAPGFLEVFDTERHARSGVVGPTAVSERKDHVEQHRSPRNAPAGPMVDRVAAASGDVLLGGAVVKRVGAVADVTQGVPLARALRVEVVVHVVEHDGAGPVQHTVTWYAPTRTYRRVVGVHRGIQRKEGALLDEPCRCRDSLRREQVEQSDVVVRTEKSPTTATPFRCVRQFVVTGKIRHVRDPVQGTRLLSRFLVVDRDSCIMTASTTVPGRAARQARLRTPWLATSD